MSMGVQREVEVKARVLVVDDRPHVRAAFRRSLLDAGFDVATATGHKAALKSAQRSRFDLCLVDLSANRAAGLGLLKRLREHQAALPMLLMVDAIDNAALVEANETGPVQVLIRPVEPTLLQKAAAAFVRLQGSVHPAPFTFRVPADVITVSATEVKNEFGTILEKAIRGQHVVINKHDTPKAVLMSVEEFSALSLAGHAVIDTLSAEFDAMMAKMQSSNARPAMDAAFNATPRQMGRAAVAYARRRRRSGS